MTFYFTFTFYLKFQIQKLTKLYNGQLYAYYRDSKLTFFHFGMVYSFTESKSEMCI